MAERVRVRTPDDFWSIVHMGDDCWEVERRRSKRGYGTVAVNGRPKAAHRHAWELAYGPIPPGMHVLHRCDNPPCVRPDHLWLGTHEDNMADMAAKGRARSGNLKKAACPRGHALAGTNLYVDPRGMRQCKTCRAARTRAYQRHHASYHNLTGWCRRGLHPMNGKKHCDACHSDRQRARRAACPPRGVKP